MLNLSCTNLKEITLLGSKLSRFIKYALSECLRRDNIVEKIRKDKEGFERKLKEFFAYYVDSRYFEVKVYYQKLSNYHFCVIDDVCVYEGYLYKERIYVIKVSNLKAGITIEVKFYPPYSIVVEISRLRDEIEATVWEEDLFGLTKNQILTKLMEELYEILHKEYKFEVVHSKSHEDYWTAIMKFGK